VAKALQPIGKQGKAQLFCRGVATLELGSDLVRFSGVCVEYFPRIAQYFELDSEFWACSL